MHVTPGLERDQILLEKNTCAVSYTGYKTRVNLRSYSYRERSIDASSYRIVAIAVV